MNLPVYILGFLALYIIFMEVVSIIENLRKMGIKIPKFIDKALAAIDEAIDNNTTGGDKDE
jgi:phage-related holin